MCHTEDLDGYLQGQGHNFTRSSSFFFFNILPCYYRIFIAKHPHISLVINTAGASVSYGHISSLKLVQQRLRDIFVQDLNTLINESSRAIFYKHIYNFNFSYYLTVVSVSKFRFALSRLRLSSHRLAVETGRWNRQNITPYEERKCRSCNTLEDEYHFVIECKDFADLRKQYIRKYFWHNPSYFKFLQLFKNQHIKDTQGLATYIFKAFEQRRVTN